MGKSKRFPWKEKENVYVLETDRKIPDQSDLQIIEQTGNTYKLEIEFCYGSAFKFRKARGSSEEYYSNTQNIRRCIQRVYSRGIIMMYELKVYL